MSTKRRIYTLICYFCLPLFYPIGLLIAGIARISHRLMPRLVWGEAPIINNAYWAQAMRMAGYQSETFTDEYCAALNKRGEYDRVLQEHYLFLPVFLKYYPAFFESLFRYDVFFISFNGFFLGKTPFWWLENHLFRIAGKRVVLIPFGLDSYVYQRIKSTSLVHGLMASIPRPARQQAALARKVDYWCRNADVVIPGFMGPDGFGRWDVLTPSPLAIDEGLWKASNRNSAADGSPGHTVYIAHAPNHRGLKGSEFVIEAVRQLQANGLDIELLLIEKVDNLTVRRILGEETDLLVDQLVATGHGLNAVEGMAAGLPVISNLEDDQYILPVRRWSFFSECPLVSASPESLANILHRLVVNPALRNELGKAGRQYVEKYHSLAASGEFFQAVIQYLYGERDSLSTFCHPLLGEFPRRAPKVLHPLRNGRLPAP